MNYKRFKVAAFQTYAYSIRYNLSTRESTPILLAVDGAKLYPSICYLRRFTAKQLPHMLLVGSCSPPIDHCVGNGVRPFDGNIPNLSQNYGARVVEDDDADNVQQEYYHLHGEDYDQIDSSLPLFSIIRYGRRLIIHSL